MDLRALPKVELHRHLEGSVRFFTFLSIAAKAGIRLPTGDLDRLEGYLTVRDGDPRTLRSFLRKFDLFRNLYPNRESIELVAREAVEDAEHDGIAHLELRFSPVHFARRMKADAVECASWIIGAARKAAAKMTMKFIVTLSRNHSAKENAPSLEAALAHRGDVVALDVAGDESLSLEPLVPLLRRGRERGLGLTIHAGEARGPKSVREAVDLGAMRLGHGVRAARDSGLLKEIRLRKIAFEICPTSNIQTGAVRRPEDHPLVHLLKEGHRVTLNTDDPQICGTNLVREFREARRMGLKAPDLDAVTDHAVEAAFLTDIERRALRNRISGMRQLSE
jgi:adenosine deaminase